MSTPTHTILILRTMILRISSMGAYYVYIHPYYDICIFIIYYCMNVYYIVLYYIIYYIRQYDVILYNIHYYNIRLYNMILQFIVYIMCDYQYMYIHRICNDMPSSEAAQIKNMFSTVRRTRKRSVASYSIVEQS